MQVKTLCDAWSDHVLIRTGAVGKVIAVDSDQRTVEFESEYFKLNARYHKDQLEEYKPTLEFFVKVDGELKALAAAAGTLYVGNKTTKIFEIEGVLGLLANGVGKLVG